MFECNNILGINNAKRINKKTKKTNGSQKYGRPIPTDKQMEFLFSFAR